MNRSRGGVLAVVCCMVIPGQTALATDLTTERVATGLSRPLLVTAPPGDAERIFILEQHTGQIRIFNLKSGTFNPKPFLTVTGISTDDAQGLLCLAFHPDYENNGFLYVNYTDASGTSVIARYERLTYGLADAGSRDILLTIEQPSPSHNAEWIDFGPDGYLYIALGDGSCCGDEGSGHTKGVGNGQDITDNLLGKMLRIDVNADDFPGDPDKDYAIPASNPFVATTGDDEIWAFGLRNPWRNSFDRVSGDLWITDVGQSSWEEVDFQPADSGGGENYGWRCREGAHDFNTTGDCSQTPFTDPIHEYSHSLGCSITGGYVYRGCAIPDLRGTYFFADFCLATIWSFRYDGTTVTEFQDRTAELTPPSGEGTIVTISSFGEDANGELYICNLVFGEVFKIVPGGAVDGPTPHDFDNDGDVDLTDMSRFLKCFGAPGSALDNCLCDVFDDDNDGDVDLQNFAGFQEAFTG